MDFPKLLQKIYLLCNFPKPSAFTAVPISQAKQHYFNQVHPPEVRKGKEWESKEAYFTNTGLGG